MVIAFDLDDTLYPESTYVESGFRAVSAALARQFRVDRYRVFRRMLEILEAEGRGSVFDRVLAETVGTSSQASVRRCVSIYRRHVPRIRLFPEARLALRRHRHLPLYLVTDGNRDVQARKVAALGLEGRFRKVLITHRWGLDAAKPSLRCFERIRELEHCAWQELVYVGDNPAKDFVGLNRVGALTVRVLTGAHASVQAKRGHDAQRTMRSLAELDLGGSHQ